MGIPSPAGHKLVFEILAIHKKGREKRGFLPIWGNMPQVVPMIGKTRSPGTWSNGLALSNSVALILLDMRGYFVMRGWPDTAVVSVWKVMSVR